MTNANKIHLTLIAIICLTLAVKMITIVWEGNDKAILLLLFGYPILIVINGVIWLTLKLLKRPEFEVYKIMTIGLLVLFIPTLLVSSLY